MTDIHYKSAPHKLVRFFRQSRDQWRQRANQYHGTLRALEIRVRDLEASRAHWRSRYFEVRPNPVRARAHRSPPASSLRPAENLSLTGRTPGATRRILR
jgi:hypothetical protein